MWPRRARDFDDLAICGPPVICGSPTIIYDCPPRRRAVLPLEALHAYHVNATATAYRVGQMDGYAAAIRDVKGTARLAGTLGGEEGKQPSRSRREGGSARASQAGSIRGGGSKKPTVVTEDAFAKYQKHKAKHLEYSRLLQQGPGAVGGSQAGGGSKAGAGSGGNGEPPADMRQMLLRQRQEAMAIAAQDGRLDGPQQGASRGPQQSGIGGVQQGGFGGPQQGGFGGPQQGGFGGPQSGGFGGPQQGGFGGLQQGGFGGPQQGRLGGPRRSRFGSQRSSRSGGDFFRR